MEPWVHPYESKSTEELFSLAIGADGDDEDYEAETPQAAVRVLRKRNTPEVFMLAAKWCGSPVAHERERGLEVLAQLGAGQPMEDRPHFAQSVDLAIAGIQDTDPDVVQAAAYALANLQGELAITTLIGLKHHPNPKVRHAIAIGLVGSDLPDVAPTLMELMEDADYEVRNWATFSLGMRPEPDSPAIRDALRKRLSDPFIDARHEGIWGLAHRKDPEGLRILLDRFETDEWVSGDEMVACDLLDLKSDASVDEICRGLRALLADVS